MNTEGYYVMRKNYKEKDKSECIAFMPERRKDPERKGSESMRKWVHGLFKGIVEDIHSLWLISDQKRGKDL